MSVQTIDATGDSRELFMLAMQFVIGTRLKLDAVTHYRVSADNSLVSLYWAAPPASEKAIQTLAPWGAADVTQNIMGWLAHSAQYPPEPDTDGSTKRGWRIISMQTGYILCTITPRWIVYGK
jgi:hypothetical protein